LEINQFKNFFSTSPNLKTYVMISLKTIYVNSHPPPQFHNLTVITASYSGVAMIWRYGAQHITDIWLPNHAQFCVFSYSA